MTVSSLIVVFIGAFRKQIGMHIEYKRNGQIKFYERAKESCYEKNLIIDWQQYDLFWVCIVEDRDRLLKCLLSLI